MPQCLNVRVYTDRTSVPVYVSKHPRPTELKNKKKTKVVKDLNARSKPKKKKKSHKHGQIVVETRAEFKS